MTRLTRREALLRFAAFAAAAGVACNPLALDAPDPNKIVVVFNVKDPTPETSAAILAAWKDAVDGTEWAKVKTFVNDDRVQMSMIEYHKPTGQGSWG